QSGIYPRGHHQGPCLKNSHLVFQPLKQSTRSYKHTTISSPTPYPLQPHQILRNTRLQRLFSHKYKTIHAGTPQIHCMLISCPAHLVSPPLAPHTLSGSRPWTIYAQGKMTKKEIKNPYFHLRHPAPSFPQTNPFFWHRS